MNRMAEEVPWPWIIDYDESGSSFYTNQETGEQAWELPSWSHGQNVAEEWGGEESGGYYDEAGEWVGGGVGGGAAESSYEEEGGYEEGGYWANDGEWYADDTVGAPGPGAPVVESTPGPGTSGAGQEGGGGGGAWGSSAVALRPQASTLPEFEYSFKLEQTALFVACERRDEAQVLALLQGAFEKPPLPEEDEANRWHYENSEDWVDGGPRARVARLVNARNSAGMTALHVACLAGAERVAVALVANGAKVNPQCPHGKGGKPRGGVH